MNNNAKTLENKFNDETCAFFDNAQNNTPSVLVIFGASGNLAHKKLFPALFHLLKEKRLHQDFNIVAVSRTPFIQKEFIDNIKPYIIKDLGNKEPDTDVWKCFSDKIRYISVKSYTHEEISAVGEVIKSRFKSFGFKENMENVIFYMATPPEAYIPIICSIEKSNLLKGISGWSRIVVEKPFGHDLESARRLNNELERVFSERQVYRIDHYLGKETVQNILIFRFANGIFEPIWNRRYIDHIQILISESAGIENRGRYYDKTGALKDMVQNHMLQLLSLTAMEPPVSFESQSIRDEKVKAIRSIRPVKCHEISQMTVRGQYASGGTPEIPLKGYREEANTAYDSNTETYVAMKVFLDNWRWAGVPFYLRTGKRLPKRVTEIAIFFKKAPHLLFQNLQCKDLQSNLLVWKIQPQEGIFLRFGAKFPGPELKIENVDMDFSYDRSFKTRSLQAYERLLLDIINGDSSLFARKDGIEAMWQIADTIKKGWENCTKPQFPNYKAGTWGPLSAEEFIQKDGRQWREPQ